MTETTIVESTQEPEPALRFLINLIIRPARAFQALAERGTKGWILVGLFVLIFTVLPIIVAAPITRERILESMRAVQQVEITPVPGPGAPAGQPTPPEEPPPEVTQFVANPLFTVVIPSITAILGVIIGWAFWAGALHLLAVFLGGRSAFGKMFQGVVAASLPTGLRGLFQTLYITATHSLIENPGLSGLVPLNTKDPTQMFASPPPLSRIILHNLLGRIDIFTVWSLFLTTLAVWAIARLNKRKAFLIVLGVWILVTLLILIPTLIPFLFMGGMTSLGG
ncbi:MAG: hypothetical protein GXO55_09905 [Chloroflexi bacterium]|nr:hypothetical protein [Chloroflexota bacterium]